MGVLSVRICDRYGRPLNGSALTDRSGTVTTGGTAQTIAANERRSKLVIANPDASEDLWIAFFGTTAEANGEGSIRVPANGGLIGFDGDAPTSAVSVYGATTGHKFTAWEG